MRGCSVNERVEIFEENEIRELTRSYTDLYIKMATQYDTQMGKETSRSEERGGTVAALHTRTALGWLVVSRVLHIHNIPPPVLEQEKNDKKLPFGSEGPLINAPFFQFLFADMVRQNTRTRTHTADSRARACGGATSDIPSWASSCPIST